MHPDSRRKRRRIRRPVVKMPGHAAFSNAVDIALTLSITLRIRL
jgi:hypothetical protein